MTIGENMNQPIHYIRKPKAFFIALPYIFVSISALFFVFFTAVGIERMMYNWDRMCAIFLVPSLVCYFVSYIKCHLTQYAFYEDFLEGKENFINLKQETIKYKNIVDIQLNANIFQRLFFVSTIQIKTANSTLKIISIKNAKEIYHFIKKKSEKNYNEKMAQ